MMNLSPFQQQLAQTQTRMGALLSRHDWSASTLGPPESWPIALKTLVGVMLGSSQAMFVIWGARQVMLYNDAYIEVLADRHPAAIGSPLHDVWPEVRQDAMPIVRRAMAGDPVHMADLKLTLERQGGIEDVHMAFSLTPVRDDVGAVIGFFCVCSEITGQVIGARKLRESEEQLRHVFEAASDYAFMTMDGERRILSWSPGAEKAFGYTATEMVGQRIDILYSAEEQAAGQPEIEIDTATREGRASDSRWHQRKDGTRVFLDGTTRPIHRYDGEAGFVKIARDETVRWHDNEALQESELRYRLVSDATSEVIWDWRIGDGEVRWSEAMSTLFGYSDRKTALEWWFDHVHPDDRERVGDKIQAVTEGSEIKWTDEYRFRRAGGGYAHVFDRGTVLRDKDGHAVGMIGAMLDLTERRGLEERLQLSEDRYRTLFNSIESGFFVIEVRSDSLDGRADFRVLEANPAFYRQTGSSSAMFGRWMRTDAPSVEDHWYEIFDRVARTGVPERFERGLDVLRRWFDGYAFRTGKPEDRQVAILFNDVSARRGAEVRMRALNETLETQVAARTADRDRMWQLSTDIMLVATFDGTILAVNPAWTALLGWREEELLGQSFLELVHTADRDATAAAAGSLSRGATIGQFENRYRAKDGGYRRVVWTAVPGAGLIHAVGRDMTPERERQDELEQAQEQLRHAQKMEAVGQLTGGIAHDFNNLLTGVIGSLDLMQRRIARGEMDKIEGYAKTATMSANRAAALTHRLLAFSRRQPLDPKAVDANRLLSGMEALLRQTLGETTRLEIVTADDLWQTLCDPHQLENAVLNLTINARDAMPNGGCLTIETCNADLDDAYAARQRDVKQGQYICICVTDTGGGMTRETTEKAFEPFFTTKPMGQGTGLGLSMIYGFARQSEGYARIYSELGTGTTFKLYLPRHQGAVMEDDGVQAGLTGTHRAEPGAVVLVVEDETAVRDLVVDVLEELGYRTVEASDGPSGLALLQSDMRCDLLMTDVGLPGLTGPQLVDAARVARPGLKVLFMTGYAEAAAAATGFLGAGMEMITKPFEIDTLVTRIRDTIGGGDRQEQ